MNAPHVCQVVAVGALTDSCCSVSACSVFVFVLALWTSGQAFCLTLRKFNSQDQLMFLKDYRADTQNTFVFFCFTSCDSLADSDFRFLETISCGYRLLKKSNVFFSRNVGSEVISCSKTLWQIKACTTVLFNKTRISTVYGTFVVTLKISDHSFSLVWIFNCKII